MAEITTLAMEVIATKPSAGCTQSTLSHFQAEFLGLYVLNLLIIDKDLEKVIMYLKLIYY